MDSLLVLNGFPMNSQMYLNGSPWILNDDECVTHGCCMDFRLVLNASPPSTLNRFPMDWTGLPMGSEMVLNRFPIGFEWNPHGF